MNDFKDKFLIFGTYFLVLLLPLVYLSSRILYPHVSPKTFFFYGVVEALFAVWIYAVITDKSYWLSKKTWLYFLFPIVFIFWLSLSGILAVNPALSFWGSLGRGTGLLTLYHLLAISIIVSSLIKRNSTDYLYKLFQWFFVGASMLAVSVWFGDEGFNLPYKALMRSAGGGLIGNSSFTAAYLLFAFAIGVFLISVKSIKKIHKWWIVTGIAIIFFAPLFFNLLGLFNGKGLLGSARGGFLGIFVMLSFATLAYLVFSQKKIIRIFGFSMAVVSICIFSFLWIKLVTPNNIVHNKFVQVAQGTRFLFWDTAQKAMNEHPWFGYGPENFIIAWQDHYNPKILLPEYPHEGWDDKAHNVIYEIGATSGYPAIILYAAFLLSILYCIFNLKKLNVFNRVQSSILIGLIFGYFFQNLFIFDSVSSLMILFILTGVVYALQNKTEKLKNSNIKIESFFKNLIGVILFILFIISFTYFSYLPLKKSADYARVFGVATNKPINELLGGSQIGAEWDVSGMAYDAYKAFSSNPMQTKNNKEVLPYVLNDLNKLLNYLETIAKNNKTDFRLYISMVDLYNTKTFLTDAPSDPILTKHLFDLLDTAHKLSPANPEVYWVKANVYAWSGDLNNIVKTYEEAIAIDPTITTSHDLLIKFAQNIRNEKLYNEALLQAQKDIPGYKLTN